MRRPHVLITRYSNVEASRRRDLSVRALVRRDDERVDASRATGAEVVVAPRPALTETRLDPLRGRQRIEASPGKEQVSGSEMG